MNRTTISLLVTGVFIGAVAACGGGSQTTETPKMLANGEYCHPIWDSSKAYSVGAGVSYLGVNYTAAVASQGVVPSTNSGPAGSGKTWVTGYTCSWDPGIVPVPTPAPTPVCPDPAWVSTTAYTGGNKVSRNGVEYIAAYWTQGDDPALKNGAAGSGQPWISNGACGNTPTPTPTIAPTPTPTIAPTPTPTVAPTPAPVPTPTDSCPPYVQGHSYATGALVTNIGNYYKCTVGGWCSQNTSAYAPGTGWAWQQAWTQLTSAACGNGPVPTPAPTPTPTPTPTPAPTPAPSACYTFWSGTKSYVAGDKVSYNGVNYQARFFTLNQNPATNSGPADQGYPWEKINLCTGIPG